LAPVRAGDPGLMTRLREAHRRNPTDAVHGVRKDPKKTRALLRLARPGLPDEVYRRENDALRDIGRELVRRARSRRAGRDLPRCRSASARSMRGGSSVRCTGAFTPSPGTDTTMGRRRRRRDRRPDL